MSSLGFYKNDYRKLETDATENDRDYEGSLVNVPYSEILDRKDLARDILFALRESSDKMSVALFDRCNTVDICNFLSNYDPLFEPSA